MVEDNIPVCDPHMHIWSRNDRPNPKVRIPEPQVYLWKDYRDDMAQLPHGFVLTSAVHIETLSYEDPCDETLWLMDLGELLYSSPSSSSSSSSFASSSSSISSSCQFRGYSIVGAVDLANQSHEAVRKSLEEQVRLAKGTLRGVRYILNHHCTEPSLTWPNSPPEDFLTSQMDTTYAKNLGLLEEYNLSFDLQCNPHQLKNAASFFRNFPDIPVCVDHLGCLRLGWGPDQYTVVSEWQSGLFELSKLPQVYIKISGLNFCRQGFHQPGRDMAMMRTLVNEVIDMFGAHRCMFASNFPVDRAPIGQTVQELYTAYHDMVSHRSFSDRKMLFHDTATRFYKMEHSMTRLFPRDWS